MNLIQMVANNTTPAIGPQQLIKFEYDWKGRRIRKQVWDNVAGSGNPTIDLRFVYDGWNLVAELNALNANTPFHTYMWGLDLSGSLQGAGGVGGLLAIRDVASAICHFPVFDGNGNVRALVNGNDATVSANYEYGPFGELIRMSGAMAKANPIRFSTKYQDNESDLLYYGYRYCNQSTGRWISRDPVQEAGFILVADPGDTAASDDEVEGPYSFVRNNPGTGHDALGLRCKLKFSCKLTYDPPATFVITAIPIGTISVPWSYTEKICGYTCFVTSLTGTCPKGYFIGMDLFHYEKVKRNPWSGQGIGRCRFPDPKCSKKGDSGSITF